MNLIKASFEIIEPSSYDQEGMFKHIEAVGRTCYKSEHLKTEDSYKKFVNNMITNGHGAMLEHGTVYLKIPTRYVDSAIHEETVKVLSWQIKKYLDLGDYVMYVIRDDYTYITTNYRVIVEKGWEYDLKYLCEPTEYHEPRITVKFVCDRGVSHEFVRHRVFSFAQESTRYCNYSKDKFGKELTFIKPNWLNEEELNRYGPYHTVARSKTPESIYISNLNNAEKDYLELLELGWKPEEARTVLPNSLKTELVMTGFAVDWQHFFNLRAIGTTGKPHPQAKELAEPLMEEFKERMLL